MPDERSNSKSTILPLGKKKGLGSTNDICYVCKGIMIYDSKRKKNKQRPLCIGLTLTSDKPVEIPIIKPPENEFVHCCIGGSFYPKNIQDKNVMPICYRGVNSTAISSVDTDSSKSRERELDMEANSKSHTDEQLTETIEATTATKESDHVKKERKKMKEEYLHEDDIEIEEWTIEDTKETIESIQRFWGRQTIDLPNRLQNSAIRITQQMNVLGQQVWSNFHDLFFRKDEDN